jgi:hypothetical protein
VRCISVSDLVSIGRNDAFWDMAFPFDVVSALLCVARVLPFTALSRVYGNLYVQRSPSLLPIQSRPNYTGGQHKVTTGRHENLTAHCHLCKRTGQSA